MLSPSAEQGQGLEAQARRQVELHRAFKRMLPRRLTNAEKLVLARAVRLTLRAEAAAADPNVLINDVVRIDGAASRARAAWARLAAARSRPGQPAAAPSLDQYLAGKDGATA
jgi:hypothetical protein